MKKYFASKTLIALAVAIAAAAGYETMANEQPMPPPANGGALPENIAPGSPVAQVIKLAQAGVDVSVIQNYIANCPTAFNLDADKIIALTDAGVSADMVNAMTTHDKNYLTALTAPAAPAPSGPPPVQPVTADNSAPPAAAPAPAPEMTLNDFNATLAPYGQWVEVAGYGRCWRPTAVIYDATWQPYCDRGRWVYTDCGWYWNSEYSWGVTFHYGRWFNTPNYGWCWWPDTVWAPSWVTWRSSGDYCGWAPLPPFAAYQPGIGFTYRGANVSVSFGFGLAANCFTFVSVGNFCQPHPRYYCAPRQQVTQIYNQTTIINNYNSHNRTIVNNGVSVTTISAATRRPIQPVSVNTLNNSHNHSWSGGGNRNAYPSGTSAPGNSAPANASNAELHHGAPVMNNNNYPHQTRSNTDVPTGHRPPYGSSTTPANHGGENGPASRPQNSGNPANSPNQHQSGWSGRNDSTTPPQNFSAPAAFHSPNSGLVSENNRVAPRPTAANVALVVNARPQHSETHQNYSQSVSRNPAPAAPPSAPSPSQPANGRSQWLSQNR